MDGASTTATACYVMRRGGVTVPVAPRTLLPYDCCGGDGAAGDSPCSVAGRDGVAWREAFGELFAIVAGEFAQAPSRLRARGYLLGLLSHSERKNGWTIAEFAGDAGLEGDAAAAALLRLGRGRGTGRAAPVRGEGVR